MGAKHVRKWASLLVAALMFLSLLLAGCGSPAAKNQTESSTDNSSKPAVHSNQDEFTVQQPAGSKVDLTSYYKQYGVTCSVNLTATGGAVTVAGLPKTLPTPKKKYKIGLALYTSVDEVGAFVLDGTKKAAAEMGIDLLVNDSNYDQNAQNQAIEQWILQGVYGVILYPADFNAVGPILKKLKDAKIPVEAGNPPLVGEVNSVFMIDNVDIGRKSATLLVDAIKKQQNTDQPKGLVVEQTLPFQHPNAATREAGFMEVMNQNPGLKVLKLTGVSPEDHYTAFEGALQAHPDIVGGWGLYDSALIGMMNARNAAKKTNVLLAGVDNDRQILAAIAKGDIVGSVGYSAYNHAYWTIDNLVNLLNGAPVPAMITGPIESITKDNVSDLFKQYYGGKTLEDYLAGKK